MLKLRTCTRYFLGIVFVLYSLLKFSRRHPYEVQFVGDIHSLASDKLFWYFFGYSQAYVIFIGTVELCSGILIILPQTYRIGAISLAVIATNIAILDFVYNVGPVQYWASFLAILSVGVVLSEWQIYRNALWYLMRRVDKS